MEKENSQKRLETSPKYVKNSPTSVQKEPFGQKQNLGLNPAKSSSQTQQKDKTNTSSQAKIEFTNASSIPINELAYTTEEPCDIIQQFVDFSSKYGLGYKLSNGAYGVHFNDSTKIALDPSLYHFDYMHRNSQGEDEVQSYTIKDYPDSLNKKVILL